MLYLNKNYRNETEIIKKKNFMNIIKYISKNI